MSNKPQVYPVVEGNVPTAGAKKPISYCRGFTLIELLVSIGLFTIILAGSWAAYLNFQRSSSLDNYSTQILSLVYQAQNQAMSRMCTQNCASASSGENFSIYFDTVNRRIILYRGIIYNPSDNYNIAVNLPSNLNLAINLPLESNIVFDRVTGEVRNFDLDHHSFSLTETSSGQVKNFDFNNLGTLDIN